MNPAVGAPHGNTPALQSADAGRSSVVLQPCWKPPKNNNNTTSNSARRLDEDKYIRDMGKLWRNALLAMGELGVQDGIFFPFGMGAFLRHLGLNDDRYSDAATMRRLRWRCADELMAAICDLCVNKQEVGAVQTRGALKAGKAVDCTLPTRGPDRIHLCLVCINAESIENHNCFLEAAAHRAKQCQGLLDVLQIHMNVDSLVLARELSRPPKAAQQEKAEMRVAILNGANRKLLGNHWFASGARFAIDENLHRRSATMSRASLLLNFACEPHARKVNDLQTHVVYYGGSVMPLTALAAAALRAAADAIPPSSSAKQVAAGSAGGKTKVQAKPNAKGGCVCCCRRRDKTRVAPVTSAKAASDKPHLLPK